MTLAWMVFGALISLAVVCGAEAAGSAARVLDKPSRGIWGAALLVIFVLVAAAPLRGPSATTPVVNLSRAVAAASSVPSTQAAPGIAARIANAASTSLRDVLRSAAALVPASVDRYLALAWTAATAMLLLLLAGVYWRISRARRAWPIAKVQGVTVRLAEEAGPAVVGLRTPEIVVPRWLLMRDPSQQRLVLAHEQEHVRASDHVVLAAGCAAVALMPWNPAVWWILSRLRLAIELDCDQRVLRQGAEARSYGSLLIDLAEQSSGFPMGAPALVDGTSHLQTRVMAMQKRTHRFARTRGGVVGLAAVALFLVACEAKLPTSAEIQQMDVASAEKAMTMATLQAANASYQIDGVAATSEQAHALRPDQILSIDASQAANANGGEIIRIRTVNGPRRVALRSDSSANAERDKVKSYAANAMNQPHDSLRSQRKVNANDMSKFQGLLVVDGSIVDPSTFRKLDPKEIESIQVIKGAAAMAAYTDPRAAYGVIDIKLKKSAS